MAGFQNSTDFGGQRGRAELEDLMRRLRQDQAQSDMERRRQARLDEAAQDARPPAGAMPSGVVDDAMSSPLAVRMLESGRYSDGRSSGQQVDPGMSIAPRGPGFQGAGQAGMPQAPTAAPPPEVQYTRGQSDAAAASGGGGAGIGDLLRKLTGSDETPDYGLASPEGGGVSGIDAEAYLQDFAQGEGRDILDETADKGARPGFFGKMSNLMNGDEWGATRGETGRGNFMDEIQGDKWGTLLRASLGTMEAAGQPGATGLGSIGTGGLKGMDFLEAKKNKEYERDYADKLFGYKQGRDTKADVFKERELTAAEASAASLAGQRDSQSGYYAKLGDNLSVEASDARDRTRILADRASTERYNAENLRSDRDADNIRQRDANATDAFVTLSTSYAESSNILPDEDGYEDVMRENNYRAIETIAGTPIAEGTSIQIDYLKAAEMANGIADGSLSITDLPEDVDPKLIAYILKRQNR